MTKCFVFVPLPTPFSNQLLPVKAAQVYNVPIHSPEQSGDALGNGNLNDRSFIWTGHFFH